MGLRQSKKEQTRRTILEVAEALFRDRGFARTSIRMIANEVPVSVQTLYNYFPSKEGILAAIAAERFTAMAAAAERLRVDFLEDPDAEGTPIERFLQLVRWGLRGLVADREFMQPVFVHARDLLFGHRIEDTAEEPYGADELRARQQENDRVLLRMFEGMQKAGALRADVSPAEIADLYVLIFSERVARWLREPGARQEDLESRVIGALAILLRGLQPDPSPID